MRGDHYAAYHCGLGSSIERRQEQSCGTFLQEVLAEFLALAAGRTALNIYGRRRWQSRLGVGTGGGMMSSCGGIRPLPKIHVEMS